MSRVPSELARHWPADLYQLVAIRGNYSQQLARAEAHFVGKSGSELPPFVN
jgi:hypothetical protein